MLRWEEEWSNQHDLSAFIIFFILIIMALHNRVGFTISLLIVSVFTTMEFRNLWYWVVFTEQWGKRHILLIFIVYWILSFMTSYDKVDLTSSSLIMLTFATVLFRILCHWIVSMEFVILKHALDWECTSHVIDYQKLQFNTFACEYHFFGGK